MTNEEIKEAVAAFYEEYFDVAFSNTGSETQERWLGFARALISQVYEEAARMCEQEANYLLPSDGRTTPEQHRAAVGQRDQTCARLAARIRAPKERLQPHAVLEG